MAGCFRLLDLNEKCIRTVLQCFDCFDLISFSLCSKKRLANVQSLKLHIELDLSCGNTFYAYFNFGRDAIELFFGEDGYDRQEEERDETPRALKVDYIELSYPFVDENWDVDNQEPVIRHWRKASFSGNDWLRHIMSVFNSDRIGMLSVTHIKFEIDSLVDTVQNLNIFGTTFPESISKEHTLGLLNALPCLEDLLVHSLTFHTPSEYYVLLRNHRRLSVQIRTLDILLYVNSLALHCIDLTIKDVNRFIKLWQKGANPRLRYLNVSFFRHHGAAVLNENQVLRRVQYQRTPQGTVRMFEVAANRMEEIDGGFDIVGKNGRKATVTLENDDLVSIFKMFIWQ